MTETVLVTGGTGFVAGWAIVRLLQQGYRVRTTLRDLSKERSVRAAIATQVDADERLRFVVADLMQDGGWEAAMAGIDYVLHVASPLSGDQTSADRYALVPPARDGTLRVLKAAVAAGVRRVVMTSAAATTRQRLDRDIVGDETLWADPDDPQFDAYRVSKILAERAAWDFMKAHGGKTEFTTVLPGAVFGPILTPGNLGSVAIIDGLAKGRPALMPRLGFWVVDVRDLVDLHIAAMVSPKAAGERFLGVGEFLWMADIARILRERMSNGDAPKRELPTFIVRLMAPFLGPLRTLAPLVGRRFGVSNQKARHMLGFRPRPATDTIVDCATSLTMPYQPGSVVR